MCLGRGHDEVTGMGGVGFEVSFQLIVVVDNVLTWRQRLVVAAGVVFTAFDVTAGDKEFWRRQWCDVETKTFAGGGVVFTVFDVAAGDKEFWRRK